MTHPNIHPTQKAAEFPTAERCYITEIMNTAQSPQLSIAQARVEPGVTTANHAVAGTLECYYIQQGEGEMFLNGQSIGRVGPGDVVRIPAETPQYIRNTGPEDLVFLCVCTPRFDAGNYLDLER